MAGLRRRIVIVVSDQEARGVVIDDFHHFRVAIRHANGIITGFADQPVRIPYTLCRAAGDRLKALVGLPLSTAVTDIHGNINGRDQCTHQFDLAAMIVAAAARGENRSYRILVTDPENGLSRFLLYTNDRLTLDWTVQEDTITSSGIFAGINLNRGFTGWAASTLDEPLCEAALALRRAHLVANGRQLNGELNLLGHAHARGGCWVQQPGRAEQAIRIPPERPDGLTDPELDAEDRAWLSFS